MRFIDKRTDKSVRWWTSLQICCPVADMNYAVQTVFFLQYPKRFRFSATSGSRFRVVEASELSCGQRER